MKDETYGNTTKNGVILHEIFDKSENNFTLLPQLPDCVTKPKRRVFLLSNNLIHILEYFRRFCLIFATHAETLLSCLTRTRAPWVHWTIPFMLLQS